MTEGKESRNSNSSFMKETVKPKNIYQNRMVRRAASSVASGVLFALAALVVWMLLAPGLEEREQKQEVQPIVFPEEDPPEEAEEPEEETPVYAAEADMGLEDYKKMYQQLLQVSNQVEKSMVNVSALMVDTDWFDETYISQQSVSGIVLGDNGLELLILTNYGKVRNGEQLSVTFFDHTSAPAVLKKSDRNTELAVISVNLSDIQDSTRDIIAYADLGSSKTLRIGEPVIAVGSPAGSYGSVLFGNLTSVAQTAALYDGSYNVLTTDMMEADSGSGVLVNWSGKIIGFLQERYEVSGQRNTVQAYGISDIMEIIEHLSNNQDIVYMGIVGADVTTAISEIEKIPIGVCVSEVAMDSPAIEAGILPGDIITSISGQPVTNLKDVTAILLKCSNGQDVQVICQRTDNTAYQELEFYVNLRILE